MNNHRLNLGKFGEKLAAEFLIKKGYRMVEKNFRTRYGEIDLIAEKGDEFLFVEVKTREMSGFGYGEQAVDYFKTKHLIRAAEIYCQKNKMEKFWRMDIVSVEINGANRLAKIHWFKDTTS